MPLDGGGVWNPTPAPPKPKKKNNPPTTHTPGDALAEHIAAITGGAPSYPSATSYAPQAPSYREPELLASLASEPVYQPRAIDTLTEVLNRYLARYDSPLTGLGRVFTKKGKKHGIDPRLLVAIAGAETNFGTYGPSQAIHNPFGMGPGINYPNYRAAIGATAKNLGENYFAQGLDTVPEIQQKWAPLGAGNDPTNLNSNWTTNVNKFYDELKQMRPGLRNLPKRAGLTELIHDPAGYWFQGQSGVTQAPYGGHDSHVHFAASNPRLMLRAFDRGTRGGLTFGENPFTGSVYPVHAGQSRRYGDFTGGGSPSEHYQQFPGLFRGKPLGQAWDITDPNPNQGMSLLDFFGWASRFTGGGSFDYGTRGVDGGAYPVTAPATAGQSYHAAQNRAAAGGVGASILANMSSEAGPRRGRRRKGEDSSELVARLIAALQESAAGQQMMGA